MKTPLSPTQLIDNGQLCFAIPGCVEVKEPTNANADMHLQQEKKKLLYSLCDVCNIQLHSAAQTQVHYNGKSHLKRVKQLNNGEVPKASATSLQSLSSSSSQGKTSKSLGESFEMTCFVQAHTALMLMHPELAFDSEGPDCHFMWHFYEECFLKAIVHSDMNILPSFTLHVISNFILFLPT